MEKWKFDRDTCVYTACYCEENIWKLCESWKSKDPTHLPYLSAVFISNERRQIPIWEQKSANNEERIVIWDYHVILVDKSSSPALIYDFDTNLSFPTDVSDYLLRAIRSETKISSRYHRLFRVIPAQEYLDVFASDRSHMLKKDRVTYNSPPPTYPPIRNEKSSNNINDFIEMKSKNGPGKVMNLEEFCQFLDIKPF